MRKIIYALSFFWALQIFSESLSLPSEYYYLNNGMKVILSEDPSSPFVAVNLWYHVGSNNEKPGKTGFAHLFEHEMFEGSMHVKDHFAALERAGGFGINASTSFDRTNYYEVVPKNELELALSLESSRMFDLVITEEKLLEQLEVVRRERQQRYEAMAHGEASLALWENTFPKNHPMFGRVIGSHEDLMSSSLNDVQSFYDEFYGPSNATLTLVGDFDKNEAKYLINKYFATLPKTAQIKPPVVPVVKLGEEKIIYFEEKLGKVPMIKIQYITPALFASKDAEMDILAHILTGGEFGRLTKAITRDKPLASAVSAYQQSLGHQSIFAIEVVLNPEIDEKEVLKEIDKILLGLVSNPPSKEEIDRAVNTILTDQFFSIQELSNRAELLQTYAHFTNKPDSINRDIERYKSVTQDSLKQAAKEYLPVGKERRILIAKPSS
jgi:zinc protease